MNNNFLRFVFSIVKKTFRLISFIIPKNDKKIIFASFPSFSDNAWALYEHMIRRSKYKNYHYYWLVRDNFISTKVNSNTRFIKQSKRIDLYLIYLFHVFTAKYLFSTHNVFVEANPRLQVSVLLWHGSPLKRIYNLIEGNKNVSLNNHYTYFLSASETYESILIKSFGCQFNNMLTLGYPRNDLLFQESTILEELDIDKTSFTKMIVYMPTFRDENGEKCFKTINNHVKEIIELSNKNELIKLNLFLKEKKVLMVVKIHPFDSRKIENFNLTNIKIASNETLRIKGLQVYNLLKYSDALVTDYSSVFCDYMVLSRPIAFIVSDIESYQSIRGFVFENPIDYMPGYIIKSMADLKTFVCDIINNVDKSHEKRTCLQSIYNKYTDGNACTRILSCLNL